MEAHAGKSWKDFSQVSMSIYNFKLISYFIIFFILRPSREVKLSVKTGEFSQMEPYHGLVFHAWLPVYRSVANQWLVKNAEPMVDLVETWESVLPSWILENILDQLILPKIQREVDNWNPLSDLIPIHAWIHPWLPKLGMQFSAQYAIFLFNS